MLEGIPLSIVDLSAGGLLILLVTFLILSIFRGWIVVKVHYDNMTKAKDHWRDAATEKDKTIALMAQASIEHNIVGQTVVKVMSVIQEKNESPGGTA